MVLRRFWHCVCVRAFVLVNIPLLLRYHPHIADPVLSASQHRVLGTIVLSDGLPSLLHFLLLVVLTNAGFECPISRTTGGGEGSSGLY